MMHRGGTLLRGMAGQGWNQGLTAAPLVLVGAQGPERQHSCLSCAAAVRSKATGSTQLYGSFTESRCLLGAAYADTGLDGEGTCGNTRQGRYNAAASVQNTKSKGR